MKQKLLFLLVLLLTATMSTWAQTTHVVTQTTVDNIFNGDGYTLGDAVKAGDVLDFQGEIDLQHSLIVNKQVTIKSTTKDAVVKLHTPEGSLSGENPDNSFVINKAGSGTTVQDIRIENTQTWLYNTSNVTFTGVTMWVEEARVGAGVGHVSIRYSDHVTFDGCTVYTKNNGGSAGCVLTGSHDCTFKDTRFEAVGNAGNILYLGYAFATDKPADYTMNDDNISVLNCTLTKSAASSVGMFAIGGLRHHIEGCTMVKMSTSSPLGATVPNSASEGHTILNNTITDGNLNVLQYCTAEGNTVTGTGSVTIYQGATANNNTITVTGNVTLNQEATATNNTITFTGTGKVIVKKGSTATGNTINGNVTINSNSSDFVGSTITGNTINGTVTFNSNSKNNTLTRNVITSTGDYAVVMASTADANNTVQYNTLKSAKYNGDEAVNPSTGTGNTISNNSNIALTLAEDTEDADKWSVKVGEEAAAFPVGGLKGGETVTITYSGEKKVKSVKAVKVAKKASGTDLATITANYEAKDGETLTGTLASNVKISIAAGATVTLKDVNITNLGDNCDWAGINCPGDATLVLEGTNTVCAGRGGDGYNNYPGIWIASGKTLTIQGDGTLTAYSNGTQPYGAGIGGGYNIACGNIVINSGTITATGGHDAAGIGGGNDVGCGNITINGGTVTATGINGGAGIGGGAAGENYASCGNITISGGTVDATGGNGAAGIGGGYSNGACGTITITKGVTSVTATKGEGAESIGKGDGGEDITVNIEAGANVTQK